MNALSSKNQSGISFVETLLTILFVGVAFGGLMIAYSSATRDALKGEGAIVATNLARGVIETIMTDRAKDADGYATVLANGGAHYCNGSFGNPFGAYSCEVTDFREVAAPAGPSPNGGDDFATTQAGSGYLRVGIRVTWNNHRDYVTLTTLVTDWSF